MKYCALIPAAGQSTRFIDKPKKVVNDGVVRVWCNRTRFQDNKILSTINHQYIIALTAQMFIEDDDCTKIVIVTNKEMYDTIQTIFQNFTKVWVIELDSDSRSNTVQTGLKYCLDSEYVFIHDGCRPYLKMDLLNNIKDALLTNDYDAVAPIISIVDSVIEMNDDGFQYVNRNNIKRVQTPQAFKTEVLWSVFKQNKNRLSFNDELSLLQHYTPKQKIKLIEGDNNNIKITFRSDLK